MRDARHWERLGQSDTSRSCCAPNTPARQFVGHVRLEANGLSPLPIAVGVAIVGNARVRAAAGTRQDEQPLVALNERLEIPASHVESYVVSLSPDCHGAICLPRKLVEDPYRSETEREARDLCRRIEPRLSARVVDPYSDLRKASLQFDGSIFGALFGAEFRLENPIYLDGVTGLW
jgi:hypothetical protein